MPVQILIDYLEVGETLADFPADSPAASWNGSRRSEAARGARLAGAHWASATLPVTTAATATSAASPSRCSCVGYWNVMAGRHEGYARNLTFDVRTIAGATVSRRRMVERRYAQIKALVAVNTNVLVNWH